MSTRVLLLTGLMAALAACQPAGLLPVAEPTGDYVPGQVLVQFREGTTHEAAMSVFRALGAAETSELMDGLWRVSVPVGQERSQMDRYRGMRVVSYAEVNRRLSTRMVGGFRPMERSIQAATPNDLLFSKDPEINKVKREGLPGQWGFGATKVLDAWDSTQGKSDVTVAVLDTGVDMSHEDLAGGLDKANARNFMEGEDASNPDDDFGHGTHVAGIIAARANNGVGIAGVAPGCRVMPIRVLGVEGGTTVSLINGINWAIQKKARVINMSLGSNQYSRAEEDVIKKALRAGIVVVAAAGNEALSGNPLSYPGAIDGVISVSAIRRDVGTNNVDVYSRAEFSNFNPFVTIAAPGVDILSTMPQRFRSPDQRFDLPYGYASGTSMAAPLVSGVVALMLSAHPEWGPTQVMSALRKSAMDMAPAGLDAMFGAGLIQAGGAVQ